MVDYEVFHDTSLRETTYEQDPSLWTLQNDFYPCNSQQSHLDTVTLSRHQITKDVQNMEVAASLSATLDC